MNTSPKSVDTITLFVEDLERSKAFYRNTFGLSVFFEDENSGDGGGVVDVAGAVTMGLGLVTMLA